MPHVFAPKLIPPKYFYVLAPGMCEHRHYINTEGKGQSANTYFKSNSSKIFSCIRTHANTGPTCIHAKFHSSRIFSCMYRFCAGGYAPHSLKMIFDVSLASYMFSLFLSFLSFSPTISKSLLSLVLYISLSLSLFVFSLYLFFFLFLSVPTGNMFIFI